MGHDTSEATGAPFAALPEGRRREAMARLAVLRPALEEGVPLARAAAEAGVPLRTAPRRLSRCRQDGVEGLARPRRRDAGRRRLRPDLAALVEGLGLRRPRRSAAALHRRAAEAARAEGRPVPSYAAAHAILAASDPAMATLAHEGPAAFRDRFETIHRRRAKTPNALWQADHTLLGILAPDHGGKPARPWPTTVIDDHPRAVAGHMAFLGAPSALNAPLAPRQAIWRREDPAWAVRGIPDVLYVDHGSDFTSARPEPVAAALHVRLVHSAVGRPQGRGEVERLFGTLTTERLPDLPGHLVGGRPTSPPTLPLGPARPCHRRLRGRHLQRPAPLGDARRAARGLGHRRLPAPSARELGGARPAPGHARQAARGASRDGIRFEGLRCVSPTLAGFAGEPATIRLDPRDLSGIRVFHRDRFLCRAVSEEHAGATVTLKDIEAARVADFLPAPGGPVRVVAPPGPAPRARIKRRLYEEDDRWTP